MAPSDRRENPSIPHLRLLARVARMYHERGLRQPEIATMLNMSQPRVSRLLKEAVERRIVRTVVVLPDGIHSDLEDAVRERFGLRDVVVVDTDGAEDVIPGLAAATAEYLSVTLKGGDSIGISSWSETLLRAVDLMQPLGRTGADQVVQLVGGVGAPGVQVQATRLTGRLAELTGARPVFFPSPGVVGNSATREALSGDAHVAQVMSTWGDLTLALVGIGTVEPSSLLAQSGNAILEADRVELRSRGAVGDVCLRYFDAKGDPVASDFDERVVGISGEALRAVDRRVAAAGGARKLEAIRAALRGGWVNILITDATVAGSLASG